MPREAKRKSSQPPIPQAPKRQVFLMPVNMVDEDIAALGNASSVGGPDGTGNVTDTSELARKVMKKNARRNYGLHSCNTALLPQSSKHSRAWLYRRFYEPIELQVETLSALVARVMFVLWYLTLVAALVLSVIPEAQWVIKNFCDLSEDSPNENLKHLDRWQSMCIHVDPTLDANTTADTYTVGWTGSGYDGNRRGLNRFRRLVVSLPTPIGMTAKKQRYTLTARVKTVELSEAVDALYNITVVCRRGKTRCDANRLPEELLTMDSDGSDMVLQLLDVPVELAARLSPNVTGQTTVSQSLAAVGIAYQKKSYSLGTIIWRYIFMFLTLLHFIRFLANRKFTSTLYEQSWVLMLQLALFWYMDPLIALNVTMHPVPSVLSFIELRIPTYFFAITLAFMFAVMTASMTWKQRKDEPSASYLRKSLVLSKNVYAPPNWTKLAAALYIIVVFVLDILDASIYQSDWISGSNSGAVMSPIYWTVIALLLFGGVVCLGLLYYLRSYLGSKPYLESRPQQLACRMFLTIFLSAIVFYVIHCFVFFLHYNRSYSAVYARQPFIQFPALLVAPMLVNIMTLVYTTRNRSESVPVLASDRRWMGIVWPDTWYRWLARHGGSQYIFSTEEEETNFYRLQFQFRCRQLMAHLKKKQGRDRRARRQHDHAYTDDDLDEHNGSEMDTDNNTAHRNNNNRGDDGDLGNTFNATNNSFGSFTLSALPSFVLEGLRSGDATQVLESSAAAASPGHGTATTAAKAGEPKTSPPLDATHDPASYKTPPSESGPAVHHRSASLHSAAQSHGARSATYDPFARTYADAGAGAGVGVLPGKLGRKLLNMDRFSTYYLPSERTATTTATWADDHGDALAQTYGGPARAAGQASSGEFHRELSSSARDRYLSEMLGDSAREASPASRTRRRNRGGQRGVAGGDASQDTHAASGFTVVGPARHRSMLQQRSAAANAARGGHPSASPRPAATPATATDDPLSATAGSAAAAPSPAASRWGTVANATVFLNALHQPPPARRTSTLSDNAETGEEEEEDAGSEPKVGEADATRAGDAPLRESTHQDEPVHDQGSDDERDALSIDSFTHLRSYEVQFPASSGDDSDDDWWEGAAAHGGAKQDRSMGFFKGISTAIGSALHTAEWHLIINPARQLEKLQDAALDAAYRPFDSSTYLPFFNLETAIDCYNMSWEAYGVTESAGDAAIETGIKVAAENVPATVKHGVSKVFCGCCAASESSGEDAGQEDEEEDDEEGSEADVNEAGEHEHRFPEDIPEEEDRRREAVRAERRRRRSHPEAGATSSAAATPSASPDASAATLPAAATAAATAESPKAGEEAAAATATTTTSVPVAESNANDSAAAAAAATAGAAAGAAPAEKKDGKAPPAPTVYPINVEKYGFEQLFVTEIRDVQLILVKMNLNEPEHQGKAPRLIVSFRGTANLSNAKYDMNIHRVVWKDMERAEAEDEVRSTMTGAGDGGASIATTAAASSIAAYTGCRACWQSCARKTSWRPTVHAGFLSLWRSMQGTVLREVKKALVADANTVYRIFTTGHSLGGALAALAAYSITRMLLRLDYPIPEVTSYTYGQPRIGNRTFRNAYDKVVPRSFRIMNESDMVVTMTMFGGYHVGIEVDVDRNGNFIVQPTDIEKLFPPTRGRGLAVMNHLMSNYGISMNAIAKKKPCPARALMTYETANPEKREREKLNDRRLNLYPPSESEQVEDYPDEEEDVPPPV